MAAEQTPHPSLMKTKLRISRASAFEEAPAANEAGLGLFSESLHPTPNTDGADVRAVTGAADV